MASGDVKWTGLAEPIVALAADGAEIRRSIESLLSVPSGNMEGSCGLGLRVTRLSSPSDAPVDFTTDTTGVPRRRQIASRQD